ncbi:MAG: helix-turn-helix transcriptional regulator [Oscillospiraceae bacterium]|nr:helix-turn-helix transcriptional regulator [Oscillospiraceae bacterium]
MDIQRNMAAVIRALKEESGKSLNEFSAELEISRSTLQEYLSGGGNPNAATIEHLARKLGVDTSVLVSGAFSQGQLDILLKLLGTLQLLSELTPERRRRFAELLLEMVLLWDGGDGNA